METLLHIDKNSCFAKKSYLYNQLALINLFGLSLIKTISLLNFYPAREVWNTNIISNIIPQCVKSFIAVKKNNPIKSTSGEI